jgi:hypothetical protein
MAAAREMNKADKSGRDSEIFDISDTRHGHGVFIRTGPIGNQMQEWDNDS